MKSTLKYICLLFVVLISCNKKIVNKENDKLMMDKSIESEILELIIPHHDNLEWLIDVVDNINENKDKVFRNNSYIFRNKDLNFESAELKTHLINDHLQDEQYWIPLKDIDTNHKIWHWLSVFVGNYNIPDMRNHLTNEIYGNSNFDNNVSDLSNLFTKTEYLIYQVEFYSDQSIGILKKSDFDKFVQLAKKLNLNVIELKDDK